MNRPSADHESGRFLSADCSRTSSCRKSWLVPGKGPWRLRGPEMNTTREPSGDPREYPRSIPSDQTRSVAAGLSRLHSAMRLSRKATPQRSRPGFRCSRHRLRQRNGFAGELAKAVIETLGYQDVVPHPDQHPRARNSLAESVPGANVAIRRGAEPSSGPSQMAEAAQLDMNRNCRPPGRKRGTRPCPLSRSVAATAGPPVESKRYSGPSFAKKITPSSLQVPCAAVVETFARVCGCAPPRSIRFNFKSAKKPSDRLSGDRKG